MLKNFKKRVRHGLFSVINADTIWRDLSFSQEGEDKVLESLLNATGEYNKKGFYVDVGAHHPFRYSNTYKFYRAGWSGINIDATPGSMLLFNKYRPTDINLEVGIGLLADEVDFFVFQEGALNTFSESQARDYISKGWTLSHQTKVKIFPLSEILNKYVEHFDKIDFLDIDTEGHDFDVLKSNDWGRFQPNYILLEIHSCSPYKIFKRPETMFLEQQGYRVLANTCNTWIYGKHTQKRSNM